MRFTRIQIVSLERRRDEIAQVWMQSSRNNSIAMLEGCFDLPDDALARIEPKIPKAICTA